MNKIRGRWQVLAVLGTLLLGMMCGCSDDDGTPAPAGDPSVEPTDTVRTKVVPLTWDQFLTSTDVQIYDKTDTSSLVVSRHFMEEKQITFPDSCVLALWLAADEVPFLRRVLRCEDLSAQQVKLTVCPADVSEAIDEGDYNLSSAYYYDDEEPVRMNGAINGRRYYNEADGTYHPVAIIVNEDEGVENDPDVDYMESKLDEMGSFLLENVDQSNFDFNLNLIDAKLEVKNVRYPKADKYGNIYLGVEKLGLYVYAGLRMKLSVKTDWKSRKIGFIKVYYPVPSVNEFLTSARGGVEVDADVNITAVGALGSKPIDVTMFKLKGFTAVYFIGPVPVAVVCDPEVCLSLGCKCSGSLTVGFKASAKAQIEAGVHYHDKAWHGIWEPKTEASFTPYASLAATAEPSVAFQLKVPVKLYSAAGPVVYFGPGVKGTFSEVLDLTTLDDVFEGKVKWFVCGRAGVEVKVAKWELGHWDYSFNLLEGDIWSGRCINGKWQTN